MNKLLFDKYIAFSVAPWSFWTLYVQFAAYLHLLLKLQKQSDKVMCGEERGGDETIQTDFMSAKKDDIHGLKGLNVV